MTEDVVQHLDVAHSGVDDAEGALICHALGRCSSWLQVNFAGPSLIVYLDLVHAPDLVLLGRSSAVWGPRKTILWILGFWYRIFKFGK